MKGLWIKDMNLLKGQKQFWIGIVVIAVILLGWADNSTFVICYMAIVASMFALNTMSYDEMQNGLSFLFTLPVSRKSYLKEKYLFGAFLSVCAVLGASLAAALACYIKHQEIEAEMLLSAMVAGLIIAVVVLAFALPLQVKFGAEKGRMALLAVYGGCFLLGAVSKKLLPGFLPGTLANAAHYLDTHPQLLIPGACGIGLLLIAVSYLVAVGFMNKKQL